MPETTRVDILVVDDNPSNLAALEALLGEFPCTVVRALSGVEALRYLLEHDVALVLLDVQMPELDGFETARLIRQRRRSQHTPIIFVTAYPSETPDVLRAYELGAVDFLFKPIVPQVLRAKVAALLELQQRARVVAEQAELLRQHERREHAQALEQQRRSWEEESLKRQIEEERRSTIELARRAAELTSTVSQLERAERELTRINQELAEADRRKDEFLAVLAHELRNPLAPIVSSIDLLRRRVEVERDSVGERALSTMDRQLRHLVHLVDDLLDVARINSGKIALRKQPLDARTAAEQAVNGCRPVFEARGQTVELETGDQAAVVSADPVRLGQVISNLLHNAARYTPEGGRIEISLAPDGDEVVLRVRDSGQGIPEQHLPHVFDMFFQQSANSSGLGVGLSLVKRLVELHGGQVSVTSDGAGKGAEFCVRLPSSDAEMAAQPSSTPPLPELDPLRIVVVDDNDDIRDLIAQLLTGHGHSVTLAPNGAQGLELIERLRPDAAIVDLGLPDLDGWSVAREVRARLAGNGPRLIAMSGYGQESDRQLAREAGFDVHLVKPANIQAILSALADTRRRPSLNDSHPPTHARIHD
jgi:two-component system, sensor histidine kinase